MKIISNRDVCKFKCHNELQKKTIKWLLRSDSTGNNACIFYRNRHTVGWFRRDRHGYPMRISKLKFGTFALFAALALGVSTSEAGILLPQQISFDAQDLDQLATDAEGLAGSAGASSDSTTWPANEDEQQPDPMELLHSPLPLQNTSSSSSSSSAGIAGFNVVLCLFSSVTTISDDGPTGRLAEDRRLSLPDAPGNDLLRPPRVA